MSTLASRLREARTRAGLKSTELSRRIGASHATVSQIERGVTTSLRADTAVALADVLGVSVAWLVTGHGPSDRPERGRGKTKKEMGRR